MNEKCHECGTVLDIEHDEYYYCPNCKDPRIVYCTWCQPHIEH